jgi:hypothetical protein
MRFAGVPRLFVAPLLANRGYPQMSNREALRKLSRKLPTPPEIEKIMERLRHADDLTVAITASAIAEAILEQLLTKKFRYKPAQLIGQLFQNRGPLMDFHSKILISHAFCVITPTMAEELHSLKSIRNVFAHAKIPITFDHELIDREVKSFQMLGAIQGVDKDAASKMNLTNKEWFLVFTRIILVMLDCFMKHPGDAHEAIDAAMGRSRATSK